MRPQQNNHSGKTFSSFSFCWLALQCNDIDDDYEMSFDYFYLKLFLFHLFVSIAAYYVETAAHCWLISSQKERNSATSV
jgi:hypothetical protein